MKSIISAAAQIEPSKRNVISLVSRIYDPLGLISPVIVQFKVLFQKLCQAKLDWDGIFKFLIINKYFTFTDCEFTVSHGECNSTVILVIFLLALIVAIVTALTVRKKKINAQNYDKNRKDKMWIAGMKAYSKAYYKQHNKRVKSQARIAYKINGKNKLAAANALSKLVHTLNLESINKCRTWYNKNETPTVRGLTADNRNKLYIETMILKNNHYNLNFIM